MSDKFLQAEWRNLVLANYAIDQKVLEKYLPAKTEIDLWDNTCYLSLVGFMFQNTRIKGIKIPFHINFEEVNLRFYVKHQGKRGVVFIKELVPKPALTFVANRIYKENYQTVRMSHQWEQSKECLKISYGWKTGGWNSISVLAESYPEPIIEGSEAEFISEHYWGYTKIGNATSEYEVTHPRWLIYPVRECNIDVSFKKTYGHEFEFLHGLEPKSVFLAQGSEIAVLGSKMI